MTRTSNEADVDGNKPKQLEQAGWQIGSASDFLELSDTENGLIEMKLSLGANNSEGASGDRSAGSVSRPDEVE